TKTTRDIINSLHHRLGGAMFVELAILLVLVAVVVWALKG
ncbi:MAG: hypothetical protein RLZZ144_850, partial [Pseudomonadota bacterium]